MKATLLLIEDSKLLRAANARLLTNAGFTVNIAGDGEEALRLVQKDPPDLTLLDMILPKLGGPEVLHALKQDSATADIPVIVLSSLSQQNESKLKSEGAAVLREVPIGIGHWRQDFSSRDSEIVSYIQGKGAKSLTAHLDPKPKSVLTKVSGRWPPLPPFREIPGFAHRHTQAMSDGSTQQVCVI